MNDLVCMVEITFGYNAYPGEDERMEEYVRAPMDEFDWSLATTEGLRRLQLAHAADGIFFAATIDVSAGRQVAGICVGQVPHDVTPEAAEKFVRNFHKEVSKNQ